MKNKPTYWSTGRIGRSILLTAPMVLLIGLMLSGNLAGGQSYVHTFSAVVALLFFVSMFWMMIYTGRTDRWRAVVFIIGALLFCISFISNLIEVRGSMTFSDAEQLTCTIPFCHIVTTMVIIPAAIKQTIIFSGNLNEGFASISSMLVIVIAAAVLMGRAFCSWGCFYGGWDDMTSRIGKRPIIKKINSSFKYFSFAMLILMALWSAESLVPQYCNWLCPFKAVTEGEKIVDGVTLIKNIIFYTMFVALVIVLPILTKKRIQCATFCPMGALMSLFNKINIFEVALDSEKCIKCNKCISKCQLMAMNSDHKPSITCAKCARCIDNCPSEALNYRIKGTSAKVSASTARVIFLYLAYSFMVIFLGSCARGGLETIFKLIF